jgi:hypothetical protein
MKTFITITLGLTLAALSLSACGNHRKHASKGPVAYPVTQPGGSYSVGFGKVK